MENISTETIKLIIAAATLIAGAAVACLWIFVSFLKKKHTVESDRLKSTNRVLRKKAETLDKTVNNLTQSNEEYRKSLFG